MMKLSTAVFFAALISASSQQFLSGFTYHYSVQHKFYQGDDVRGESVNVNEDTWRVSITNWEVHGSGSRGNWEVFLDFIDHDLGFFYLHKSKKCYLLEDLSSHVIASEVTPNRNNGQTEDGLPEVRGEQILILEPGRRMSSTELPDEVLLYGCPVYKLDPKERIVEWSSNTQDPTYSMKACTIPGTLELCVS